MTRAQNRGPAADLLRQVLPGVSRSFALSLRVLPVGLRGPLGLTYLLARAADTLADTHALPPRERRRHVEALRAVLRGGDTAGLASIARRIAPEHPCAERTLLQRLPEAVAGYRALPPDDRERVLSVLGTLTQAMLETLERFPAEGSGHLAALETPAELARYTYMNAGCVGEFWTDMMVAHRPRCAQGNLPLMRPHAVRFGQALQLTNVLRDLPRDLRMGRCYLPRADLASLGLSPEDLLEPTTITRARPLVHALVAQALAHAEDALAYTLAIPRPEVRLRLACAWPLLIGLATLAGIVRADGLLDPGVVVKIPRRRIRRLLGASVAMAPSNRALRAYVRRLAAAVPVARC